MPRARTPRRTLSLVGALVASFATLAPASASAQTKALAPAPPAATSSPDAHGDYVDQTNAEGQRVVFKDDPLGADGNAATGATILVRPRAARVGLLRPRVQFIPEMLKSVEDL